MNKEELLSKELYYIKSNLTEAPFFVKSQFFMIFTNKTLALDVAQRISKRLDNYYSLKDTSAAVYAIKDNDAFFRDMMSVGFGRFSFNGEGEVHDVFSIYGKQNTVSPEEKDIYIEYMGYVKIQKSSHIGSVKTLRIERSKQNLSTENNVMLVKKFTESLNRMESYCSRVYLTNADLSSPADYLPINRAEEPAEYAESQKTEITVQDISDEKNDVITDSQKKKRPIVSVIMFVYAAFFALAFLGTQAASELPLKIAFGVSAASFCILGIAMLKWYLRGFGWAIGCAIYLAPSVESLFSGDDTSGLIICLIITLIFGGLFFWANRKKRNE